ncbi:MAG TPA: RNA polymerase sigma factor, partial [Planctomycetota bacterium]|nr:RNA polymerase sigma factor [Planctomycetota bacterium]
MPFPPDPSRPPEPATYESRDEALPKLVEREGPRLHTLARRFCGNPDQAEDLVQEVFLQAFKSWDQFRGDAQVGTWLYRIAARTCMRMQRRRSGEPDHMESLDDLLPSGESRLAMIPGPEEEPLSDEIKEEGRRAVQQAIMGLPETFRMPLVLKEMVGFSVAEVAAILDIPEATVKTRLHRARLKLRRTLDASLPTKEVPPFALDKAICMDLLSAKQGCLDRGEPFVFPAGVFCERCRDVFSTLDFTQEL